MKDELIEKINKKEAIIGIFGLGYVGLPLSIRFSSAGFKVIGFDIDSSKVTMLNQGETYIKHISSNRIKTAKQQGFGATTDFSRSANCDALIICVPTPLTKHREPDLQYVISTIDSLASYIRPAQVISLESTTYPGTTEEELLPRVESGSCKVGRDIFLIYSPEREDPGNTNFETKTIPKICGGHTKHCLDVGIALYQKAIDTVVPLSSTKAAELTKLLENIHRAVNIGLVNEMKVVADKMNVNIHEVIQAAATKPFGFTAYYPGPGLGGHCIPIDPFYLTWKAREYGLQTRFIELAGEVNTAMPAWVSSKLTDALNQEGKSVKGSRILILGIAYKKDVDDMRESPSVEIMDILIKKGAIVDYSDPYVPTFPKMRKFQFDLKSVELTPDSLSKYDAVILSTNHQAFDYDIIKNNSCLIVDTRGHYQESFEGLVRA